MAVVALCLLSSSPHTLVLGVPGDLAAAYVSANTHFHWRARQGCLLCALILHLTSQRFCAHLFLPPHADQLNIYLHAISSLRNDF